MQLLNLAHDQRWQLLNLEQFLGHLPEGLQPHGALVNLLPTDRLVRQLLERKIPTVRIGNFPHPKDHIVPAVMTDYQAIGRLAAEHFAERDLKRVAYVGHHPWGQTAALRCVCGGAPGTWGARVTSTKSTRRNCHRARFWNKTGDLYQRTSPIGCGRYDSGGAVGV